jgi:YHYH protein
MQTPAACAQPLGLQPLRRRFLSAFAAAPLVAAGAGTVALNALAQQASHPLASRFYAGARAWVEGEWLMVGTRCIPDHGSPYFLPGEPRFEDFRGTNPMGHRFHHAPNQIMPHDMVLRIPLVPQRAATVMRTPMGPIGVALNGVPFFNQLAGGGAPLSHEIVSFDQYNGHPTPHGMYHYHVEPMALTRKFGRDALLGLLLDGFPVYGPIENGREVRNADLDVCHGHSHATRDFPEGIYHYHCTREEPYLNGQGFYGNRGQIARASFEVESVICHTPIA